MASDLEKLQEQIRKEYLKYPRSDSFSSCVRALCRNCTDGESNETQQGWEDIHHNDIIKAVITFEHDETVYFLNNIKSMPGSQFNFDVNAYNECNADPNMKAAYKYRILLYQNAKYPGFENKIYRERLKFGYHRKDRESKFATNKIEIQKAMRSTVRSFAELIINTITDYLDDRCSFCRCHLGIDFIPNHPNGSLSCYACKASSKSLITQQNALKKYPKLTLEILDQLTVQNKSEKIDDKLIFFVHDVNDIYVEQFGDLKEPQTGNDSDYFESDDNESDDSIFCESDYE